MLRLVRSGWWLLVAAFLALGISVAAAQDAKISLMKGMDLPGGDYSIVKNTTLDACEQACGDDKLCRAFTYNTKTKWCFLKGTVGTPTAFAGATSGTVDTAQFDAIANARFAELPFPAQDLVSAADSFSKGLPTSDAPPKGAVYQDLISFGDDAAAKSNPAGAAVSYRQALALNPNDPAIWKKLADVLLVQADDQVTQNNSSAAYDLGTTATYAALNAFVKRENPKDRAADLAALGHALEIRTMWREAIATYRTSVALVDDADLDKHLDQVVAEHGFRITDNTVDAESANPRICVTFSDPLLPSTTDLSSYVVVANAPQAAVETEDSQICVTGVQHGLNYNVKFRAGLPSSAGETLRNDVSLNVYVPDRTPFVGFANNAYVLPAGLGGGLPITSVNAASADIVIYRIGDRSIVSAVRNGIFQGTLAGYSAEDVANQYGEQVWKGAVDLAQGKNNEMQTTAIPVADVVKTLDPGAYVITAKVSGKGDSEDDYYNDIATQWFIVTDLGITDVSGDDGVHAFVRSLTSAQPVAGANVRLLAANNEVLGQATTDANGEATFAPGLARGTGGRAPQLLVADTGAANDYNFLDISKTAFDLSDRGVAGRASPGALDVFATTERGVYRPGETVFLTALLRDVHSKAVTGMPLTMDVERPDGVVATHTQIKDGGAGGYFAQLPLTAEAMRGSWHIKLYADPTQSPLANVAFLVEDFEPERLAFDVQAPDGPFSTEDATDINVAAKYLYGATAPGLDIEADSVVRPVTTLDAYPGYTFGRLDDTLETDRESLGVVGTTDDDGNAVASVTIPEVGDTTRPLMADVILSLVDTTGRTVTHTITRPVLGNGDDIGLKPDWNEANGLDENSNASFSVIDVAPTGETIDKPGMTWVLNRVETTYQWYRESDTWKWEPITTTTRVADGTIDATASGPVTISAPVTYGRYQLEVDEPEDDENGASSSSYEFYAGYYYPEANSNTPDTLQVALDKESYKVGDTANLRLDPQFAGTALVMVVDDRIIDMKAVDVPEGGTTVQIPVTADWGPGAYVTAMLYRPASATEKRMPARALGLAFADVDPGDLKLGVSLDAPKEALPRQPLTVNVKLGNAAAGEQAYVAIAAVDLGILNITNFPIPDPDGYFFGQRSLGVEFRDLYGQLIDPTQGLPGALRQGGDESAARLGTPPATSVLVALHSGIVTVGPDGTAQVKFDMPDFNGTVRLMAAAWTASQVGHSSADVVVHDPVVVNMTPPRFLRYEDTSRLLVEINNISGQPGTYKVQLDTGAGLSTDAPEQTVDLAVGDRASLNLSLTGTQIGDNKLKLTVIAPNGDAQVKELTLGVRAAAPPITTTSLQPLDVGQSVSLTGDLLKDLVPHTGSVTVAIGPIARLNVPELLIQLDRYPYGCAEQLSSRAMPLLYLNDVAKMLGMGDDAALDQRIKDAIQSVLAKQTSTGGFGLWGPFDSDDLWLDAYVTEFLLRAKDKGYDIPALAMSQALDNLGNQVSYATDFSSGGEDIAYALYDLAKSGRAAIGDLRYYFEAKLDDFGSPLAQAQLGAALAMYGDKTRSADAFAAALEGLKKPDDPKRWRTDYGTQLRDTAAVLALAAEAKPSGVDLSDLAKQLAALRDKAKWTSTQEDAWTLIAAATLADATSTAVTVDGEALKGTVYRRYDQEHFDNGGKVDIANTGNTPTEAKVTVTGIPTALPKSTNAGMAILRQFYTTDGTLVDDISQVKQNDEFVVVLTMKADQVGSGQYVASDPLPAGFEIENSDLNASGDTSSFSWLDALATTTDPDVTAPTGGMTTPTHTEARTDQYVAAWRWGVSDDVSAFRTAYVVRAVSPGKFVLPAATVEDMYRPELRGNTDAGQVEITAAGQ